MVVTGAVIILMARYGIKVINGRPRTPRTQGLVEQANGVMKDKLSKRIEATGNPNWSEHLIRVALAMNTQGHSSLPYNVTPYKVFFGRKYRDRANSLTTVEEAGPGPIRFTDEWINDAIDKNLPLIDEVMEEYVEHEAYNKDEEEDEENSEEEDTEKNGGEDGETDEERVEDKQGDKGKKDELEDEEENEEEDEEEREEENEENDEEEGKGESITNTHSGMFKSLFFSYYKIYFLIILLSS